MLIKEYRPNTKTLYAVCCGIYIWQVFKTREEADRAAEVKEEDRYKFYSHHAVGSPCYNFPYVMKIEPGRLRPSVIHNGFCSLDEEVIKDHEGDYYVVDSSNYIPCYGVLPLRIYLTNSNGEKMYRKEF